MRKLQYFIILTIFFNILTLFIAIVSIYFLVSTENLPLVVVNGFITLVITLTFAMQAASFNIHIFPSTIALKIFLVLLLLHYGRDRTT